MRSSSTGRTISRRSRRFLGTRVFDDYSVAELIDYIDWSPFFSTWELTGKFPAILDDEKFGEAARALYEDARAMLEKIVEENWFRAAAIVGFWPANSAGDDILVGRGGEVLHTPAPAAGAARGPRQCGARRFHRAEGFRTTGLHRCVRRHGRHRRGRDRGSLQACERRLFLDHGQGAGRSPRGGFRRAHASARAQGVLGLCGRRDVAEPRTDRGKISRHPSGAGLSGAAGSHREGDAVPADRRRADRREADRELRDVAGRVGVRGSISATPRRTISASARSSATRSRTMRRARAGASPRPSAGSRRSSTTTRSR